MKKTKLLMALCLAGSMGYAQIIYKYAGTTSTSGFSGDGGLAVNAKFGGIATGAPIQEMDTDASGNIYFADTKNNRVRKINAVTGIITTFAGGGTGGDGGQATAAGLSYPSGIAIDGSGNVYVSEFNGHKVRKIDGSGIISTVAGTGTSGYSGDGGSGASAKLSYPMGIDVDASGNLFIADAGNYVVRKVNNSGIISTIAGNGTQGFLNATPSTSGELNFVTTVKVLSGVLYVADPYNGAIRQVSNISGTGHLTTFTAPTGGVGGSIAFDGSGLLYLVVSGPIVQKVNVTGTPVFTTVAGNGTQGNTGDGGAPTSAELNAPAGIYINGATEIFIYDQNNYTIRKVTSTCPANAGPNGSNSPSCNCPAAVIGTPGVPSLTYAWSPGTNLGSTSTATTTSSFCSSHSGITYTLTVSGTGCTTNTSTVFVAVPLTGPNCGGRLANTTAAGDFGTVIPTTLTVFPNPAKGTATLSLSADAEYINITDMQGRLVFETKNTNAGELKIDLAKYNKGIYFISAKIGNTIEKQKLMVE